MFNKSLLVYEKFDSNYEQRAKTSSGYFSEQVWSYIKLHYKLQMQ